MKASILCLSLIAATGVAAENMAIRIESAYLAVERAYGQLKMYNMRVHVPAESLEFVCEEWFEGSGDILDHVGTVRFLFS